MIKGFHLIPHHMRSGLDLYLRKGIMPGSFMTAVLENKLVDAFGRADDVNKHCLKEYAEFLYNYAPKVPVPAWGSPEIVAEWSKRGGADGIGLKLMEDDQ